METKACYLHLGVNKSGVVKYVKVTAYRCTSQRKQFEVCTQVVKDLDGMYSFGCDLKDRQTAPFKKLIDSVYNPDFIIAVIRELEGR